MLATEVYRKLGKQYPILTERKEATRQYILNEISQWGIKSSQQEGGYFFKPTNFQGTQDSPPFEVRLIRDDGWNKYELKFGNLNNPDEKEQYKWMGNDPFKLQKALFLNTVLRDKVVPLILNGDIPGVMFIPFDEDGLGDDRLSYFRNMFDKVGKDKLQWTSMGGMYFITKKED